MKYDVFESDHPYGDQPGEAMFDDIEEDIGRIGGVSAELPSEYIAQTKLDEAVYTLLEAGWSASDILKKVDALIEEFDEDNPPDE